MSQWWLAGEAPACGQHWLHRALTCIAFARRRTFADGDDTRWTALQNKAVGNRQINFCESRAHYTRFGRWLSVVMAWPKHTPTHKVRVACGRSGRGETIETLVPKACGTCSVCACYITIAWASQMRGTYLF